MKFEQAPTNEQPENTLENVPQSEAEIIEMFPASPEGPEKRENIEAGVSEGGARGVEETAAVALKNPDAGRLERIEELHQQINSLSASKGIEPKAENPGNIFSINVNNEVKVGEGGSQKEKEIEEKPPMWKRLLYAIFGIPWK